MLVLNQAEVRKLLPAEKAVELTRQSLHPDTLDGAEIPLRTALTLGSMGEDLLVMPANVPSCSALGVKLITGFPANAAKGMHPSPAAIVLFDTENGAVRALLDATYLTDVRTAAITAVACELIHDGDFSELAVIGAGVVAEAHIRLFSAIFDVKRVRVSGRTPARLEKLVAGLADLGTEVEAASSAAGAVREANVVIAATTASDPVVQPDWLSESATVCGVGSNRPGTLEIPPELVASARVVVADRPDEVLKGPEDFKRPVEMGLLDAEAILDLHEVVREGRPATLASDSGGRAVFKSVGTGEVDLVIAAAVVAEAEKAGIGRTFNLAEETG